MNSEFKLIYTPRLLLRMGTQEDVPEIVKFYRNNQGHLSLWQPFWPDNFLTHEFWQEQVEKNIKEFECDRSLKLFIFKNGNFSEIIGNVSFHGFMRGAAQFCYLGYNLAEFEQGKGYMTEALHFAINDVFAQLDMHRVMANYLPHNHRSANLLKKLEFVVEGYARKYLLIQGEWQDHILTSLTNKNWQRK
ncbi:GNAT family N-acetyltransferase [Trichocoleus sp. DQ-A3]|uniref:GNAT family N-acetyltransferase n=1 Tax=Cyanophyceae TaxID=3028117 RepID=UPI001682D3FC|nr:GNAT family N-acetyltransferase [Coleofasciculus sp. FACHB-125]MBD1901551.1 GNAT family N-acetyltransferase [Coleofasciculus sp. FACHB-125]